MCFGDKLDEKQISEIERVQFQLLLNNESFCVFSFFPGLAKMVLRKRWSEFLRLRKEQEDVLIPLIRARGNLKKERATKINEDEDDDYVLADTLVDLELPDEKRKLTETEMMGLCSEFLIAGVDTTATALQWIMANLVKNPQIQNKLLDFFKTLIGNREKIWEGEIGE
ncbi:Cytochrome P450 89A2 [Linum perenne]